MVFEDRNRLTTELRSFDEDAYLLANPDIAAAVYEGRIASGWLHYERYGRDERRSLVPGFDEKLYLRRYPDVARAVWRCSVASGAAHYERDGRREGRSARPTRYEYSKLLAQFCSLGIDCEFGMVQLHYDAATIDLLKFAYTPWETLSPLLNTEFALLGQADLMTFTVVEHEWVVAESAYGLNWHTGVAETAMDETVLRTREAARLSWLAKKFASELRRAGRVLVRGGGKCTDVEMSDAYDLVKRYHPDNVLLWVKPDVAKAGTLTQVEPGLFVGYVENYWRIENSWQTLMVDAWLAICLRVLAATNRLPGPARRLLP